MRRKNSRTRRDFPMPASPTIRANLGYIAVHRPVQQVRDAGEFHLAPEITWARHYDVTPIPSAGTPHASPSTARAARVFPFTCVCMQGVARAHPARSARASPPEPPRPRGKAVQSAGGRLCSTASPTSKAFTGLGGRRASGPARARYSTLGPRPQSLPADRRGAPRRARSTARAARTARSASSSCTRGIPKRPTTASPMNFSTEPPKRSITPRARA